MSYPTCPRCGHSWHALPCRTAVIRASPFTDDGGRGWGPCTCPADEPLPIPAAAPAAGPLTLPQENAA